MTVKKRDIISRLIPIPKAQKRAFWAREMKMLNSLMEEYKSNEFWQKVRFSQSFDSLSYLLSAFGKSLVKKKFNEFNFKIKPNKKPILKSKIGEDRQVLKTKNNIKDFF